MKNNNSNSKQNILLVGGGTGGHIFPLYPLAETLLEAGHTVHLIVNDADLDRDIISQTFSRLETRDSRLKFHYLRTYKVDYHLSLRNLVAPFKILGSFFRTKSLINKIKPDTVFFKGGFVGFPVLVALKYLMRFKSKVYLHDSDISAGKLTQLIGKNADHIFSNFGSNATPLFYWPSGSNQVRTLQADQPAKSGLNTKPKILVFGGSQGAQFLNNLMVQNIEDLGKKYVIDLVVGPKNIVETKHESLNVHPFMPQDDLIKQMIAADLVICRSGASMFQVLAAQTRCIAIPLPTSARNHQYDNAKYFTDKGLCYLLEQNHQTAEKLLPMIEQILNDKELQQALEDYEGLPQADQIVKVITA